MSETRCTQPLAFETLLAYWLGEQPPEADASVEEHFFACIACARRLEQLAALAAGVRAAVRRGALRAVITPQFLQVMRGHGMRIREYRVAPGGRVACTIRIEDDAVVGRLHAPLAGVTRVDLLGSVDLGPEGARHWRFEDVPFDPDAGEVVTLPAAAILKTSPAHTLHVRLVAVEAAGERPLGEYTFAHSPG